MRFGNWLSIAAVGAVSVCGQSGLVGPNSGYLFDAPSRSVRLMQGSLGAAALGEPVLDQVDFASISPGGNHAIGCRRGLCFIVTDLTSPDTLPLASNPEGVAWAADGTSAVLYSRIGGWIQVLTGLAGAPDLSQAWHAPASGPLLSVAYDGRHPIIAMGGSTGGVFEVTEAGGLIPVDGTQSVTALVVAKSGTVYALDGGSPAVLRIPLQGGPVDRWDLPLKDPSAIQLGPNLLYVSGRADQSILALDPQTGEVKERTDLSFQPSLLEPLPGGSFLLTSRTDAEGILWSFVPSRGAFFIPAPAQSEETQPRGRRR